MRITVALAGLLLAATALAQQVPPAAENESPEYIKGKETLARVTGAAGSKTVENLQDIAPELGRWVVEWGYGQVLSRPQLDLRSRELATVAALTALGHAQPQLRAHIHGALNVGCKPEEVVEVIMQMAAYAGFPAALNGIAAAKEVFAERGVKVNTSP
ncbi:MAG: carboxymuconolactone decarboxylase family protein [Gammaproteobacteria bacterium]|nr:carboxymuconolactone decarboxylase family protein [Gammaproteobacteria bacterium]